MEKEWKKTTSRVLCDHFRSFNYPGYSEKWNKCYAFNLFVCTVYSNPGRVGLRILVLQAKTRQNKANLFGAPGKTGQAHWAPKAKVGKLKFQFLFVLELKNYRKPFILYCLNVIVYCDLSSFRNVWLFNFEFLPGIFKVTTFRGEIYDFVKQKKPFLSCFSMSSCVGVISE